MPVPYSAVAKYPYTPDEENAGDDLPFSTGQVITVTEVVDSDWLYGSYKDLKSGEIVSGFFPRNFVDVSDEVTSSPAPAKEVKAEVNR